MKKQVQHKQFGLGTVLKDEGDTQVIQFEHEIHRVLTAELEAVLSVEQSLTSSDYSPPLDTLLRIQAAAITSVNDAWGVFSRSRIALLPHQLWVCHRALRQWPIRLLIADDVGLGKTIEAGLILWPLLATGAIRRLLILTPASLTTQWQARMRDMFDIRLSLYHPEIDTDKNGFWTTHQQVVASLPTLRTDRNGRHNRLLQAPAWDMVLVDEAHHLHADENRGKTLGFELIEMLQEQQKIHSCILFTGTPHRGKPYGFWSLMSLLDSSAFSPYHDTVSQLRRLPDYLIRNCKQKVVDMEGNRIFKPIVQYPETYHYSKAESDFYSLMTQFITSGRAYASTLDQQSRGQVILVLIALQKLASSSVAAVSSALKSRKNRLSGLATKLRKNISSIHEEEEETRDDASEALRQWQQDHSSYHLKLMENEMQGLDELLVAAERVEHETRITRIIEIIEQRFLNQPVLLFTEYKTTQALMVSALMQRFGKDSVGFINGDDRLSGVISPNREDITLTAQRETTARQFNAGDIRFLVSTEAGGEGIDLQERCHCLIHIDLPWNPMRLHQRVGRLNRYGQKNAVEVVSIRNPETIESMIWTKLETKLGLIMQALGTAMDEPEDLLQLVLGMTDSGFFNDLFSSAHTVSRERLDQWFDDKTKTFGGLKAVETVQNLVGHAQSFDLSGLGDVPRLDLPDLVPFFKGMLHYNGRRVDYHDEEFKFLTPEAWLVSPAILKRYDGLVFRRNIKGHDAASVLGIGHPVFDQAVRQAKDMACQIALLTGLDRNIFIYSLRDKITTRKGQIKSTLAGVSADQNGRFELLKDHQVIQCINTLLSSTKNELSKAIDRMPLFLSDPLSARLFMEANLPELALPYVRPEIIDYAVLIAACPRSTPLYG